MIRQHTLDIPINRSAQVLIKVVFKVDLVSWAGLIWLGLHRVCIISTTERWSDCGSLDVAFFFIRLIHLPINAEGVMRASQ